MYTGWKGSEAIHGQRLTGWTKGIRIEDEGEKGTKEGSGGSEVVKARKEGSEVTKCENVKEGGYGKGGRTECRWWRKE
jgi:hypothetical protein